MKCIRNSWCAGENVTIDESIIKYKGKAVAYMIMYNPMKPIKHRIEFEFHSEVQSETKS